VRSKISLASIATNLNEPPVHRVRILDAITGKDTVVLPTHGVLDTIEKIEKKYDQVDYFEIVAVSPVMSAATPLETVDDDEEELYCWGPPLEPRPSARVENILSDVSVVERPSFGRRMLLVNYEHDIDERDLERAKDRVRRTLGVCTPVWHGRTFTGYCFVDNRVPDQIIEPLYKTLDQDDIEDYLLVQLINMVLCDKSGLSRLDVWMKEGFRRKPARFNNRDRRIGQSGRRD